LCFGAGEHLKVQGGTPQHGGGNTSPYVSILRNKDNKLVTPRDEKTASIRSYPKRLSPAILEEFYENAAGILSVEY